MKVVVSVRALAYHLKVYSLMHAHGAIDDATDRFITHRCPHTFMEEIESIPGAHIQCIGEFAMLFSAGASDQVEAFAAVRV